MGKSSSNYKHHRSQKKQLEAQHHLHRTNPFGKHQRLFALFVMFIGYQAPFLVTVALMVYSLIELDHRIWIGLTAISVLQYPVKKSPWYIHFVNHYINPLLYFEKFERVFEEPIPKNKDKCMFSFHPHGVFAYGLLANMNYYDDAISKMVGLSSRFMLNMPITGLLLRIWGVQSVDPKNIKALMKEGTNVGLLPGGFEEATLTTAKALRVFIRKRKGFIKYALKHNYTIYPTLILNEHKAFWTFDHFLELRMMLNKIKMPGVIFFHPKTFLFYPSTVKFVTIVGKGLNGKRYNSGQEPTPQQIDQMHDKYVEEVERVYEKHKDKNENVPLVIF